MKTQEITNSFAVKLADILVSRRVITQEEGKAMQQAFEESGIDQFDDFLVSEELINLGDLLEALAEYFSVPGFDVVGYFFERHLLHMFPKKLLISNRMIPLEIDENMMIMIVSNPDNADLLVKIGECVSYDIRFYVGIGQDIIDAIQEFYDESDTELSDEERLSEEGFVMGEFHFDEDTEEVVEGGSYEEDFNED